MSAARLTKTGLFRRLDIEGYEAIQRELELHRAVLDKALTDWFSDNKKIRIAVDNWLRLDNPDFTDACERAMLDTKKVYETFYTVKKILKGNNAQIKQYRRGQKR